ncbi:hypothetical protein L596_019254 [Steinernema carpocapsae]|uniref:THO complex subunit 1 n=1 Tax=Steinernema carpocapsae TaxID=34508 RepID=A0A4U5MPV1_STECR|nr:hypothetical protein L596_019254 [Steinernema carpocapsae]
MRSFRVEQTGRFQQGIHHDLARFLQGYHCKWRRSGRRPRRHRPRRPGTGRDQGGRRSLASPDQLPKQPEVPLDRALYAKFWRMQNFFASPSDLYDPVKFNEMNDCLLSTLDAFRLHKVQKRRKRKRGCRKTASQDDHGFNEIDELLDGLDPICGIEPGSSFDAKRDDLFCCRYFTDFEFFEQQMCDLKQRRSFLVQCLIMFQYLQLDARCKEKSWKLTPSQSTIINDATQTCYDLLADSGSGSSRTSSSFARSVKNVMNREQFWIKWKNDNAPAYTLNPPEDDLKMPQYNRRLRQKFSLDKVDLGNSSMTKIWDKSQNLLEDCQTRRFYPKPEEILDDPLDAMDPESQVEEAYQPFHKDLFQFRMARFLSRLSPSYWLVSGKEGCENYPLHLKRAVLAAAKTTPKLEEKATAVEGRVCRDFAS